jgi:leucyl aminopeptidase
MTNIKISKKYEDVEAVFKSSERNNEDISISFEKAKTTFNIKYKNPRDYAQKIAKIVKDFHFKNVGVFPPKEEEAELYVLSEQLLLSTYSFDKYKNQNEKKLEIKIISDEKFSEILKIAEIIAKATNYTRDLVNEPPNGVFPKTLKDEAEKITKKGQFEIEVFSKEELENMGFQSFLAVASGSSKEPYFVHISYKRPNPSMKIAIVGKALTFDSGGLNIKNYEGMVDMKIDMAGSAIVLGIFEALSELKPDNIEVHGFFGACENMPSGSAMKPGDIVRAYNGKTIEILNTDAEGRLTLADILAYISKNYTHLDYIIDFATLTGAIVVALGEYRAGVFTPNKDLYNKIEYFGNKADEGYWLMPLDEKIAQKLKSKTADIKNTGDRAGGAIFAALFLREFVDEPSKWAHIDIAGVVSDSESGATGFGVRTMLYWILDTLKFSKLPLK